MAELTPRVKGQLGYVEPYKVMFQSLDSAANITDAPLISREGTKSIVRGVLNAADGDTFTTGISGLKHVWWKGRNAGTDEANVGITDVATGEITVSVTSGVVNGYILIEW